MEKVTKCTVDLVAAIRESSAYKQFEEVKLKLKADPELYARVNQFRRQNYELQNTKDNAEWIEKLRKFEKENEELRQNEMVEEFLMTELAICRQLQRINKELAAAVDLEIGDFADAIEW